MMRRFRSLLYTAAIVAAQLVAGCDQLPSTTPTTSNAAQTQPAAAVPVVQIVKPLRKTVHHPFQQPGFNIEAFQETPLYARITGYVLKWNVDIGDSVHKNQLLAELYVPEMAADVEQKQAALRQSAAQIEQANAAVLTAQAQVDRLKSQYERLERIGKSGVLDQENVAEVKLNYQSAKAALVQVQANVNFAKAQRQVAQANLDYSQTMLGYAKILAPYDGVVTQRNVNSGDLVMPAVTDARPRPIFMVDQIDPVRVFVNIPAADAPWIKDGDPVRLLLQGTGGRLIHGKVTRNARSLDPSNRTLRTEIDLPNPDGKLLPGMFVYASMTVEHSNVWTLPADAVRTEGDQTFCFRLEGGKAVQTPLQIGLKGDNLVEVLMMHIKESVSDVTGRWLPISGNEEVIVGGPPSLANGQAVQISPPPGVRSPGS